MAPRVHRDARPNPQPYFDRGIVWIEIRCCTLPALDESRREAMMGFVADPAAGVESGGWSPPITTMV